MRDDPIVEETRAARRELDAEFGGDMAALVKYLKQLESENKERLVHLERRPPFTTTR
jgi:(p)ppGpp synthase/HD superfamily hydrolase